MDFNAITDRRGSHSAKWDLMEPLFGVSPTDGLSMWTADSDYPTAPCVIDAVRRAADHGIFGYFAPQTDYQNAIIWWMQNRHSWQIEPDWILTSQGLGHAIGMALDVWSDPGDGILIFSPVYHEFRNKINRAGRAVVESPLARDGDTYVIDFDDAQSRLDGSEKILIWCSPQNPSGRIWTADELRAVADFATRNDLILISDEVHHDFIYPGETFVPMDVAAPEARARTVTITASSKTFNIAGLKTGNLIIPDADLRAQMANRMSTIDYSPNRMGLEMVTAAYTPEGAEWVDAQVTHLIENRRIFDDGINALPGIHSLPLQSTYLAWVDFSGTGMAFEEHSARIRDIAKIAVSPGRDFGAGGEDFQRINLAAPRAIIEDAVVRMQRAFGDLQ